MLLWHVGVSFAFIRYAFRDPLMDLRFLALGAVLSDIVDLPIGVPLWERFETVRLFGHTMLFGVLLMIVVLMVTRRGLWRKRLILLPIGVLMHLGLDAMWQSPETLWWPFLGAEFAPAGIASYGSYAIDVLTDPLMWLGEAVGLVYLVALWQKADLGVSVNFRRFVASGVVSAPIDPS